MKIGDFRVWARWSIVGVAVLHTLFIAWCPIHNPALREGMLSTINLSSTSSRAEIEVSIRLPSSTTIFDRVIESNWWWGFVASKWSRHAVFQTGSASIVNKVFICDSTWTASTRTPFIAWWSRTTLTSIRWIRVCNTHASVNPVQTSATFIHIRVNLSMKIGDFRVWARWSIVGVAVLHTLFIAWCPIHNPALREGMLSTINLSSTSSRAEIEVSIRLPSSTTIFDRVIESNWWWGFVASKWSRHAVFQTGSASIVNKVFICDSTRFPSAARWSRTPWTSNGWIGVFTPNAQSREIPSARTVWNPPKMFYAAIIKSFIELLVTLCPSIAGIRPSALLHTAMIIVAIIFNIPLAR